jgi:DNA-binding NarL/FixJ family response regulator
MNDPIRVFVVAPPLLCWGFEKLVRTACPGIRVIGGADTLSHAMHTIMDARVDVMVVDVDEGYDAEKLRLAAASVTVILLASSRNADIDEALRAEVSGIVRKNEPPSAMLRALEGAYRHDRWRRPDHDRELRPVGQKRAPHSEQSKIGSLTSRERQLVFAVVCNATAPGKVIANRLCISEHTLRNHLSSIYGKLGVQNRLSLHAFAVEHRLDCNPGSLAS